jgi:metal-responsive CopG/Arc/MetJ family transcriptional regulator
VAVPKDTKRVSLYLPKKTAAQLERIAKRSPKHRSVSELLRDWIVDRVEEESQKGKR